MIMALLWLPFGDNQFPPILQLVIIWIPFIILIVYGQKIQAWTILGEVSRYLNKLKMFRDKARVTMLNYVQKKGTTAEGRARFEELIEFVTILPVDLDPVGIVKKLDHVLTTQDIQLKEEVARLLPRDSTEIERSCALNMVEVAAALNSIYKVVRHFYILGKKSSNVYILAQLQMILPTLLREAEALVSAMKALEEGQPLGDGVGPLVVSHLMKDVKKVKIARETVMAELEYKGRKLALIKAEGPQGSVGKVDEALINLLNGHYSDASTIIMIDAALKLEGEKTGEVAEGIGAAIGGLGVEKFKIEEIAHKYGIPLYAVIIKESIIEAISIMKKEIAESVDEVKEAVLRIVENKVPYGGKAIIIGVGNTLGISQ